MVGDSGRLVSGRQNWFEGLFGIDRIHLGKVSCAESSVLCFRITSQWRSMGF